MTTLLQLGVSLLVSFSFSILCLDFIIFFFSFTVTFEDIQFATSAFLSLTVYFASPTRLGPVYMGVGSSG